MSASSPVLSLVSSAAFSIFVSVVFPVGAFEQPETRKTAPMSIIDNLLFNTSNLLYPRNLLIYYDTLFDIFKKIIDIPGIPAFLSKGRFGLFFLSLAKI